MAVKAEQNSANQNIFVLTGAGISAESGIPIFQGTNWRGRHHAELANIGTWKSDPQLVWEYYSERRSHAVGARPNPAHAALAEFESTWPQRFFLCTQNVDGLHEEAGSRNLVHIHGKLFQSRCAQGCGEPPFEDRSSYERENLPRCRCGALVRPDVCWFGEEPFEMDRVIEELERSDVFVAMGTSGTVQPVASFVATVKGSARPVRTIFIGLERPMNAHHFDEVHLGSASALVPMVLKRLANGKP
ncbi:MAG TPA: Sir2 family NAD-dependent protein deacetylase [Candidatus Angelobacter sp.]|nr:Sir2 family NAD-dependent protein deacetylase [Candidatus Angelobacter sp.]